MEVNGVQTTLPPAEAPPPAEPRRGAAEGAVVNPLGRSASSPAEGGADVQISSEARARADARRAEQRADASRSRSPAREELAELAEDAGVGTLVLTHQVPTIDDEAQIGLVFRAPISAIYRGELVVAVDGTSVTVPVN